MKQLVFATGNHHKVREVQQLLAGSFELRSLDAIGCFEELPETSPTIEENAIQKALFVYDNYGVDCFAEDTGLEIKALDGKPGVHSARYAGDGRDPESNIVKVLEELDGVEDRSARFLTVIALVLEGEVHIFEGIVNGSIRTEMSGSGGFGYDPIFQPDGFDVTFAEMEDTEKNKISHRGHAVQKLMAFLRAV